MLVPFERNLDLSVQEADEDIEEREELYKKNGRNLTI